MNLQWRRATYSSSNGGNCIEVATADHTVSVRDSKDPNGPCLAFGVRAWQAFATKLRGERSLHPLRRAGCQNQSETWSGPLLADRAGKDTGLLIRAGMRGWVWDFFVSHTRRTGPGRNGLSERPVDERLTSGWARCPVPPPQPVDPWSGQVIRTGRAIFDKSHNRPATSTRHLVIESAYAL